MKNKPARNTRSCPHYNPRTNKCGWRTLLKIAGAPPVDTAERTAGEVVDFRGKRKKKHENCTAAAAIAAIAIA